MAFAAFPTNAQRDEHLICHGFEYQATLVSLGRDNNVCRAYKSLPTWHCIAHWHPDAGVKAEARRDED